MKTKKGFAKLAILSISILLLFACVTTGFVERYSFTSAAKDDNVSILVEVQNDKDVAILIQNLSNQPIQIDWDSCVYKTRSGESKRVIHSGVRLVDRNQPQAKNTIAANGKISDILVASDAIYYTSGQYGGWSTGSWIPIPPEGVSFVIAYSIDGKLAYLECDFTRLDVERTTGNVIGQVTANKTYWHVFFIGSPEGSRKELLDLAKEAAMTQYGSDINITNPKYDSKWSAASLLLYFSMLGWVEKASVTVDVVGIKN